LIYCNVRDLTFKNIAVGDLTVAGVIPTFENINHKE
jgi:hypothetical protein